NTGGHKRLGSTEAGLQIMAFDEVSENEAAGLADFDFGGDEDDVDQMFDDVFGSGDIFGGGDVFDGPNKAESNLNEEGDELFEASDDEEDRELFDHITSTASKHAEELVGATAHDGGEPLDAEVEVEG